MAGAPWDGVPRVTTHPSRRRAGRSEARRAWATRPPMLWPTRWTVVPAGAASTAAASRSTAGSSPRRQSQAA